MDEDPELNRLVRASLEAKAPFEWNGDRRSSGALRRRRGVPAAPRARGISFRRRLAWTAATLLAASVALVATFHVPGRGELSPVEDALLLLAEAEGVELNADESASSTALLLAWQAAPI